MQATRGRRDALAALAVLALCGCAVRQQMPSSDGGVGWVNTVGPSEQQLIDARVELDGARSRRAELHRRGTETLDRAERERLAELVSALDLRISDLEQQIAALDAQMARTGIDYSGSSGAGGGGSSGGCGSRGGAGYRLPSGKCASNSSGSRRRR